jgi:glycine betaine/proline transport system ATP-binding protein
VGIARSLAVEPEVWFLDEPFSALDPLIRTEMQDEFLRLQRLLHKTIVFITHDFDEAIRLADRIAIMKDGEIVQIGTAEELITRPADDYVSEFTSKIPRSKVISAKEIMDNDSQSIKGAVSPRLLTVHMGTCIDDCAQEVLTRKRPVCVVDDQGEVVGTLSKEQVLETLFPNNDNDDGQDDGN